MNKALWKSIRLLSHPITLAALMILLINDHLLRRISPSWWTGKIGDFAWLFFFPFALAVILSFIVPQHLPSHEKIVGYLAFGLTACVFTLAKTTPFFHNALHSIFNHTLSYPIQIQLDPTDTIALLILLPAWKLWERSPTPRTASARFGWVALPVAALLTIANASAPDYGINCFSQEKDHLIATATWETFMSYDGGLTWQSENVQSDNWCDNAPLTTVQDAVNPSTQFRFTQENLIEISMDDGETWEIDYQISSATEAEEAYYLRTRLGNPTFIPGPLDAISDASTGNIIVAMGHQGVLVRQPDSGWSWIPVGEYQRAQMGQPETIYALLSGELLLALILFLLLFSSFGGRTGWAIQNKVWKILRLILVIGTWTVWIVTILAFSPALMYGYIASIPPLLTLACAIVSVPLFVESLFYQIKSLPEGTSMTKVMFMTFGCSIFAGILFSLPFTLWAIGSIGQYHLAAVFALFISAAFWFAGDRSLNSMLKRNPSN